MFGGSDFCVGERLAKIGWKPVHTDSTPLLESLPVEIEAAVKAGVVAPPDYSEATEAKQAVK